MSLATDPQEFNAQVNADIRDQSSPEVYEALRRPENLDRWILALTQMKRSTESQLASHRAGMAEARATITDKDEWLAYKAKQERIRSNVIRVKNGTENKLDEANYLRHENLATLVAAIEEHKHLMTLDGDEATEADLALWSVID